MTLSRRGFLKTVMAGLAGAAVFDPLKGLWLPQQETPVSLVAAATASDVEAQVALNDLALRFAREVGRSLDERALTLHEVIYRTTKGAVAVTTRERREVNAFLGVDGLGPGMFYPGARDMHPEPVSDFMGAYVEDHLRGLAKGFTRGLKSNVMLVPIGRELRPGVPFGPSGGPAGIGVDVGLGTDPDSGVSARVLRFETTNGRRNQQLLGFELAAGAWVSTSSAFARAALGAERYIPDWHADEDADDVLAEGE